MTLLKANEILTTLAVCRIPHITIPEANALNLGIEAMKRLQENRNLAQIASLKLLPGETIENTL